jgi:phasin family protein
MAQASEHLSGWQRAAIDTTIACTQAALAGAEELLRLNLEAARTVLEQHAQTARALLAATDPGELMSVRARAAQQTMQQAASYARDVYELVSETQAQLAQHAGRQLAGIGDDLIRRAGETGESAPGAEVAMAAVKSSLAASAAMIDNLNRATRQFADVSEATIRAAAANMVKAAEARHPAPNP